MTKRTIEEETRETISDIRNMIEKMPPNIGKDPQTFEEWRAFLTESSVRLENLLRPLRYSALADELERFHDQLTRFRIRFDKLARD